MNFLISLAGWFIWNIAEAEVEKREKDGDGNPNTNFSYKQYAKDHVLIWGGSFVCIFVLLWIGARRLDISPFGDLMGVDTKAWHDLYILASGAVFEAVIFGVKKVRAFFKKKEKDL